MIFYSFVFLFVTPFETKAQSVFRYEGYIENAGAPVNLSSQVFTVSLNKPGCADNLGLSPWVSGPVNIVNGEFNITPTFSSSSALASALDPNVTHGAGPCGAVTERELQITWNSRTFIVALQEAPRATYSVLAGNAKALGGVSVVPTLTCVGNQYLTVSPAGQIQCTNLSIAATEVPTTTPLAGDITGTIGASQVAGLRGSPLPAGLPTAGQIIKYNGSNWIYAADDTSVGGFINGGNSFGAIANLGTTDNQHLNLITNGTSRMMISSNDNNGRIGIGTTVPATALEVNGAVRVGFDSNGCASGLAGALRNNGSQFEYCNGSTWNAFFTTANPIPISSGGTASTSFTANSLVSSNATGTALTSFGCSNGQVIGFNASNVPVCEAVNGANQIARLDNLGDLNVNSGGFKSNRSTSPSTSVTNNNLTFNATPATSGLILIGTGMTQILNGTQAVNQSTALGVNNYHYSSGVVTNLNGMKVDINSDGAGSVSSSSGVFSRIQVGVSNTTSNATGIYGEATSASGGIITTAKGVHGLTLASGTSGVNMGAGIGVEGQSVNTTPSGSLATAIGVKATVQNTGSGSITNAFAFEASINTTSGTITNAYGLRIPTFTGTIANKWGVYQSDANAKNFFAGKVGIGTTNPEAALDVVSTGISSAIIVPRSDSSNRPTTPVNGMIRYNTLTLLFEFYQNGSWVNFTTISDGRLKTNVTPVNQGLDIINQLNPVYFDWDQKNPRAQSFGNQHQVGFIAQEVEKVLPEVVNIGEDNYRSVEYGKIVAVVVAAIQELYQKLLQNDELNVRQNQEISELKNENAIMKTWICSKDPEAQFCQ